MTGSKPDDRLKSRKTCYPERQARNPASAEACHDHRGGENPIPFFFLHSCHPQSTDSRDENGRTHVPAVLPVWQWLAGRKEDPVSPTRVQISVNGSLDTYAVPVFQSDICVFQPVFRVSSLSSVFLACHLVLAGLPGFQPVIWLLACVPIVVPLIWILACLSGNSKTSRLERH